jgi:hypothetical protein
LAGVIYSDYWFFLLALPDGWFGRPASHYLLDEPPPPQELWESIKDAVIEIDAEGEVRIAKVQKSLDKPKHWWSFETNDTRVRLVFPFLCTPKLSVL